MSEAKIVKNVIEVADALGQHVSCITQRQYTSHPKALLSHPGKLKEWGGWSAVKALAVSKAGPPPVLLRPELPVADRYLITWAQCNTPVNKAALFAMLQYCKHNEAEFVVLPGLYQHKESMGPPQWDPVLHPYLFGERAGLGSHLCVYGDIQLGATVGNPLAGLAVFAGTRSALMGHPQVHLRSVASKDRDARLLVTTGAVTEPNYTNTRAGDMAQAHHCLSAAVVELDRIKDIFHLRQFHVDDDGVAYDLDTKYGGKEPECHVRPSAMKLGDLHVGQLTSQDSNVLCGVVSALRPHILVLDDVLDFSTRNHHSINNLASRIYSALHTTDSVLHEVAQACSMLVRLQAASQADVYVTRSNHDEAFDRWLDETNPKMDPANAPLYFETWAARARAIVEKEDFNAFQYWFHKLHPNEQRIHFLRRNSLLEVEGVVMSFHGDKGVNGGRGTRAAYTQLGCRTMIGHSHSAGIQHGVYQTGVSGGLDHGYNLLPSSWISSHGVVYPNGKRTLVNVIRGTWRFEW